MSGAGWRKRVAARVFVTATELDEYVDRKRRLLGDLTGDVLEIGPGDGRNLRYFRPDVRWVGLEPNPILYPYIRDAAAGLGREVELVDGVAGAIPLPDASVDAVVATLVLCSVPDQRAALAEVRRVLRPGGRYVFIEHVAAPRGSAARWVQRLARPACGCLADGCRPDRETLGAIESAGFATVQAESFRVAKAAGALAPHIAGFATR
jgi:ubiquinone/menaquinone biosynthesis C-methylase UbiE